MRQMKEENAVVKGMSTFRIFVAEERTMGEKREGECDWKQRLGGVERG